MAATEEMGTGVPPAMLALGGWINGAAITLGLDVGHRAGLFDLAAEAGPATSAELASTGGLSERHVREWLGLMTVAGVFSYRPTDRRYTLEPGFAMFLVGDSPLNMGPVAGGPRFLAQFVPEVVRTVREGGGIPYEACRPDFTEFMDALSRRDFDFRLIDVDLAAVPGLVERLRAGIRVCDIGCGTGHAVNVMARAFPPSTFLGYDFAADAIAAAEAEARRWGLGNARFEVRDVTALPADASFDLVTAFDTIHDQSRPRQVLAEARRVLADDGVFLMVDINASSHLEENVAHPMGPFLYATSLFHCMQVSLAVGGEGLGTAWGRQLAEQLLTEAGFGSVELPETAIPHPVNSLYVCRP